MAAFEYGVAFTLTTPGGDLTFNPSAGSDGYRLTNVTPRVDIAQPVDNLAQRDGGIVHRGFKGPTYVTLEGFIQADAGLSTRRSSVDTMRGYLERLLRPTAAELVSSCRLKWTPSGANDRMYDAVRLVDGPTFADHPTLGGLWKTFSFTLVSPYPYALDVTQTTTSISSGGTSTLNNTGNVAMYPVVKVKSAPGSATVANNTYSESIVLASVTGLSGSDYAEIDCFNETVYKNGNSTNLQGFVTQTSTVYFSLRPGNNVIAAPASYGIDVLWQAAWS